jgi:hypothetical protein
MPLLVNQHVTSLPSWDLSLLRIRKYLNQYCWLLNVMRNEFQVKKAITSIENICLNSLE